MMRSDIIKEVSPYIFILLLILMLFFLPKFESDETFQIDFGYDSNGKYLIIMTKKPTKLHYIKLNNEEIARNLWVPIDGAKIRYPWSSKESYMIEAKFDNGKYRIKKKAPYIKSDIDVGSVVSTGSEILIQFKTIEYDRVEVFLAEPPEEVLILDYPVVSQTKSEYDDYIGALISFLSKSRIKYRYSTSTEFKNNTIMVIAFGALPKDPEFIQNIRIGKNCSPVIYIGARIGSLVETPDGNIDTYQTFPGLEAIEATVKGNEYIRMKRSSYTSSYYDRSVVRRDDGKPAIYETGCALVFTSTINTGWESPEDAAWDTFMAIISKNGLKPPIYKFNPRGDVLNTLLKIDGSNDVKELLVFAYKGDELSKIEKIVLPESNNPLPASIVLLDKPYPGKRKALIKLRVQETGKDVRVIAVSRETGETYTTTLGKCVSKECTFRKDILLPSGPVLLAVEYGGRLSNAQEIKVRSLKAVAKPEDNGYLLYVYEDGEPYVGEVKVSTPEGGSGNLNINGQLRIIGSSFTLAVEGTKVPVTYSAPPSRPTFPKPLLFIAIASAMLYLIRRSKKKRDVIIPVVIEIKEEKPQITIKASKVIEAIEKYNKLIGMEYYPLDQAEFKYALSIYATNEIVTDEMIANLIEKMNFMPDDKLKVVKVYGYYVPLAWEKKISESVEHITMCRAVYDFAFKKKYHAMRIIDWDKEVAMPLDYRPDLVLTDRYKLVYVEVVSPRQKKSLKRVIRKYVAIIEKLREVDKEEGYGFQTELWVVLPDELYKQYRQAVDSNGWDNSVLIKALEKEKSLRVFNISHILAQLS